MLRVKGLFPLLFVCFSLFTSSAQASRSTIENDALLIPRVDIEGYGALELVFHIVFEGEYYFDLAEAAQASQSISNAATFDGLAMELEVFEIELVNGDIYAARLGMASQEDGYRFRLLDAQYLGNEGTGIEPPPDTQQAELFYGQQCAACHGQQGQGTSAGPSLISCANCSSVAGLASYIASTMPLGNTTVCDAECAELLSSYIMTIFNGQAQQVSDDTVGFITTLAAVDTVRKAGMKLVSRLPTLDELQLASNAGDSGIAQVVDGMVEEEAFYRRLSEIFNDYLLTDKYHSRNGSEAAVRLLDRRDFPNARWFDPGEENRGDSYSVTRQRTNDAIAREPLELINFVVRNDRPFTEIVTADYLMVNPHSARSYGIENVNFRDPEDHTDFQPARIDGIPHAGILTSPMFLNRYPTTRTNRNRGRARVVFDIFLDTDILAIEGVRPGNAVDITTPIPTIDNPLCSKCHVVLDPVASIFQNWDYKGRYRPSRLDDGWYSDMELRGFNGEIMPLSGNVDSSVQWLGGKISLDPKFPRAMVRVLVKGLTGKEPLTAPDEEASQEELDAYIAERTLLNNIQARFVDDNYNLKTLVREIILSPYWRADGLTSSADMQAHANTGSQYLLSPEELDRKVEALFGFQWRGSLDNYHREKDKHWASRLGYRYHQIYGGIDSDDITSRLTSPNGLMGAMQLRMANELACYAVPNEFMMSADERNLLPFIELDTLPFDENGDSIPRSQDLIRQNIQYLHEYLLGETLPLQHEEIQATEDLFLYALDSGQQFIRDGEYSWSVTSLPAYCRRNRDMEGNSLKPDGGEDRRLYRDQDFVIRSWMAVVAYLLADYRFFYE